MKNYKAAENYFRRAIEYSSDWVQAHEMLIDTLVNQKLFDQATEVCDTFIEKNPGSDKAEHFLELKRELEAKAGVQQNK